jgi:hypothetical protein
MIITFSIILIVSLISLFLIISYRVWEIRTSKIEIFVNDMKSELQLCFRNIEKITLYFTKKIILNMITLSVKFWLILKIKIKKKIVENWPKIHKLITKTEKELTPKKNSFIKQTILEAKVRVSKIKEKIKNDHKRDILN